MAIVRKSVLLAICIVAMPPLWAQQGIASSAQAALSQGLESAVGMFSGLIQGVNGLTPSAVGNEDIDEVILEIDELRQVMQAWGAAQGPATVRMHRYLESVQAEGFRAETHDVMWEAVQASLDESSDTVRRVASVLITSKYLARHVDPQFLQKIARQAQSRGLLVSLYQGGPPPRSREELDLFASTVSKYDEVTEQTAVLRAALDQARDRLAAR